ncbi:MAG: PilN domain-containing protein [Gemmatimonadaceae bacterium]
MIEINLHPGSGKKAKVKSHGSGVSLKGLASGALSRIKDPFLIGAVATAALAVLLVGGMYSYQHAKTTSVADQLQKATQDSMQYAIVIQQKRSAEAQRDSVVRQVKLIESFDNKRYVWPHIMDEVSRALPPYTWIKSVTQSNATDAAVSRIPAPGQKGDKKGKDDAAALDSLIVPQVRFKIVGNTVDIQALTRFMKLLEASPFIQDVQLERSGLMIVENKEVTQFQLSAGYQTPDSSAIRTVPVTLSVR